MNRVNFIKELIKAGCYLKRHGENTIFMRIQRLTNKLRYIVRRKTFKVRWYYISPEQIQNELKAAGFKDIEIYGSFAKEPIYYEALRRVKGGK